MPIASSHFDPALGALFADGREALGDVEWFDAHTHIGHNDPDGFSATTEEILAGLDAAGHRAGAGLPDARARRLPRGQRRGARRLRRAPAAGSRRSCGSTRTHADAARRGPPRPAGRRARGQAAPALRRLRAAAPRRRARSSRWPASAGPSSSSTPAAASRTSARPSSTSPAGTRARRSSSPTRASATWAGSPPEAAELPNLFFDTAWWQVVRPAAALRDDPAGADPLRQRHALRQRRRHRVRCSLRCARAVGPGARRAALRSPAGRSGASSPARRRSTSGRRPVVDALGPRVVEAERAAVYLSTALQLAFREQDADGAARAGPARPARPCAPTATPRCSRSWPGCARWPSTRPAAGRTRRRP